MQFAWDDRKSARNAQDRGLPFEIAMVMFDGPTLEIEDRRQDYGETRMIAVGVVSGRFLTCVYTDREDVRRIISLRVATRRERDAHRSTFP